MGTLINIWREVGSYVRYANARALALFTLNASLIALCTSTLLRADEEGDRQIFRLDSWSYTVVVGALVISQAIIVLSFVPMLERHRSVGRHWLAAAKVLGATARSVPLDQRNPFFFGEISQFENAAQYFGILESSYLDLSSTSDLEKGCIRACAEQTWTLSRIASIKFAQFSLAVLLLGAALALYAVAVAFHLIGNFCDASGS